MPACEPESYDRELIDVAEFFAGRSRWVYEGWSWDGPLDPENQPEAMAVKDVVDRYQPEVHQDVHGIWFEQSTMTESTGISWASNLYRGYWRAIPELMNLAAEDAGYLTTRGEESAGQMLSTIPVEGRRTLVLRKHFHSEGRLRALFLHPIPQHYPDNGGRLGGKRRASFAPATPGRQRGVARRALPRLSGQPGELPVVGCDCGLGQELPRNGVRAGLSYGGSWRSSRTLAAGPRLATA